MERTNKIHIGDGVYVWFDGHQVWLEVCRIDGEHRIALDRSAIVNLVDFSYEAYRHV